VNHRPTRPWRRRITAILASFAVTGTALAGLSMTGANAAPAVATAAAVTAPAPDLLDVDFQGTDGNGNPVDHSASSRAATKIGTPVFGNDSTLNRSLPSFNDDAGPGNATPPAGTDADGFTYNIADAYTAGTIQDGFAFACTFKTNGTGALSGENEICGDKYSGGFGFYVSANSMLLNATVYDGAYQVVSSLIKPNTWYDAVETWDGHTLSLYLDGVLMGSKAVTTLTAPAASRQVVALGGSPSSATALNFRGQETMAGARLWSTPLTADQVAAAATSAEVTRTTSAMTDSENEAKADPALPAGKSWPAGVRKPNVSDVNFVNGDAVDTVSGATGTVARNTGSSNPAIGNDTTLGQKVATFDGTNAYAFATDGWNAKAWNLKNQIVRGNNISMECVFKLDKTVSASHYSYPCGEIYSGGAGFYTAAYAAGATTSSLRARVGFPGYTDVSTNIKTDTWYDAVLVWDGENVLLYLNGQLVGLSNKPGAQIARPTYDFLTVGGSAKSATSLNTSDLNSLWGSVASSRVWTQALTESEIGKLYTLSGVPADGNTGGGTPTVTVPKADVLDVDLLHGDTTDHANRSVPKAFGSPAKSWDSTLKHTIETFDGVKDALSYDFSDYWNPGHSPNVTTGFTVECYFRSNGTAAALQKTCSGEQTGGISIAVPANSTNTVQAEAYINGGYKTVSAPITANAWNHVVFTFNGSAEKLYVNGVLKAFSGVTGSVSPPGGLGFNLGADIAGSWPTAESFSKSSIAIARVWSSALSDQQVQKLYAKDTSSVSTPAADVLDVDFHDHSYADASPSQLVPEEYGTPQIVTDPTLGRPVAAFGGDGSAQVYDLTPMWDLNHTPTITKSFTIQCDFRYDGTLPAGTEQDVCSGKQTGGYSVNVSGSSIRMRTCVGDGGTNCPYLTAPIQAGVWYAFVATWDSATNDYKLYLNGQLVSAGYLSGIGDDPQATPMGWALGADVNGSGQPETPAPVSLAEARIWSSALSAEQVSALYQQDFGQAHTDIALTSTNPAEGATITKATELKVQIQNKDQATGWRYDIDGVAVQPGSTIGAGFAAGKHLLTISAVDSFGVPVSFTVSFSSSNIPGGGTTQTGQGGGKVTLSAVATSPKGGDVTTTFKVAAASVAEGGETGAIPSVPSTLDFSATDTRTLAGAQAFDGDTARSVSAHDLLPYEKFDVAVPEGDARHVRWAGTVDPERVVTLYAWDTSDLSWEQIATANGSASGDTALEGDVRDSMVDTSVTVESPYVGKVHLLAVASDPFADDLSPRDGSNAKETFLDPSKYDFSFAHWTDPQYVAEGATGGSGYYPASPQFETAQGVNAMRSTVAEQRVWAAAYNDAAQWTVDNAERRKIVYASNTGDIINNNLVDPAAPANLAKYGPDAAGDSNKLGAPYSEQKDQIDRENSFAKSAFQKIWGWRGTDGKGLVSQVVAGNHDNRNGTDAKTSPTDPTSAAAQSNTADDFYNGTFSAGDYYAQSQSWPAGASYHTIDEVTDANGNVVTPGSDNQDNYVLFSAGGQDFVAVGLSYGVSKAEADWASSVFQRYHDRNGILITHGYLSASPNQDGRTAGKSSDGSRLFTKVVTANPNVFLVLAGHVHGVGTNLLQVKDKTATVTHKTVELLADYQEYQMKASQVFTKAHCEAAGLTDVYDPATGAGAKCKELGGGLIDVDGDGTADHHDTDSLRFGASFLRLLQFNLAKSTMTVESYSPFFDEFGATQYDSPNKRYNGSEDAFTVPVDLKARTTSFATDGLAVLTPSEEVIGTSTAKSGLPATVTWSGLHAGDTYAWTATSVDADGDDAGSADHFGGLFVATKAGTDTTAPVLTVPANKEITVGDDFNPITGATATDDSDGDLTARIVVTGSVDTSTAGTYPLLYTVVDDNGNTAQRQRVVTVKPVAAPQKTGTSVSASNLSVTFGKDATLRATVSPAGVSGTVVFNNGEDPICQATVSGGVATCVTQNFGGVSGQSYVADATFYPDDVDHYEMSEKAFVLTVNAAPKPTNPGSTKKPAGKPVFKVVKAPTSRKIGRATITVAPKADGKVTVVLTKGAKHRTLTVTLKSGKVAFTLPKLAKGTWRLTLKYLGSSHFLPSHSTAVVKVRK